MNYKLKSFKKFKLKDYKYYVIGADIGGTHTRIGFAGVKEKKVDLLFSITYPSDSFDYFYSVLNHAKKMAKEKFGINVKQVNIATRGAIQKNGNFVSSSQLNWSIDRKKLMNKTKLKILPLINDLEARGHSLDYLGNKSLLKINSCKQIQDGNRSVIAVGTGLGKCTVYKKPQFFVAATEMGHNAFAATSKEDVKIVEFIKKVKHEVQYEDLISGRGLENLYDYYSSTMKSKYKKEINSHKLRAKMIAKYSKKDSTCRMAVKALSKYLGRFARNVALNDLPYGGLYIGGTVASNNTTIFNKDFLKEFSGSPRHQKLLKSIPIFIILDDDAGIRGSCVVAANEVFK